MKFVTRSLARISSCSIFIPRNLTNPLNYYTPHTILRIYNVTFTECFTSLFDAGF